MVVELVKILLENERYNALLDLLNETSEFTGSTVTNIPNTKDEIEFVIKANHHICLKTHSKQIIQSMVFSFFSCFFDKK